MHFTFSFEGSSECVCGARQPITEPSNRDAGPPTSANLRFRRRSSAAMCESAASGLASVITLEPAAEHGFNLLVGGAGISKPERRFLESNAGAHRAQRVARALLRRCRARACDVIASERIHLVILPPAPARAGARRAFGCRPATSSCGARARARRPRRARASLPRSPEGCPPSPT